MADAYDSDVRLKVSLTTEDVKKTAVELKKILDDAFKGVGTKTLSVSLKDVADRAEKATESVDAILSRMHELEHTQIKNPEYAELEKILAGLEKQFDRIKERMRDFIALGGKDTSKQYKRLELQLERVKNQIEGTHYEMEEMKDWGTAFTSGIDTVEYQELERRLNAINGEMTDLKESQSEINGEGIRELGDESEKARTGVGGLIDRFMDFMRMLGGTTSEMHRAAEATEEETQATERLGEAEKKVEDSAKSSTRALRQMTGNSMTTGIDGLKNAFDRVKSSSDKFERGLKRGIRTFVRYAFGVRSFFFLFRKLRSAIMEGFTNLQAYSEPLNQSITTLKNSLTQLKNQFAASFSPIVTAVLPYIQTFINALNAAISKVGQFIAALAGKKTWTRAKAITTDLSSGMNDAASATGAANDAAKEYKKTLMGFDDVNILNEPDSSSSSGGGGGAGGAISSMNPQDMFEEVAIESGIQGIADALRSMIEEGDWEGVGAAISEKITQTLRDIKWENIRQKSSTFAINLADFLNGLLDPEMGYEIGNGLVQLINTGIDFAYNFGYRFDWENGGEFVAEFVNGLLENFDAEKAADTVDVFVQGIYDFIVSLFSKISWDTALDKVKTFLSKIDLKTWGIIFGGIIMKKIVTGLVHGVGANSITGVGPAIASSIGTVLKGALSLLFNGGAGITLAGGTTANEFATWLSGMFSVGSGGDMIAVIFTPIIDKLNEKFSKTSVGEWFTEHINNPVFDTLNNMKYRIETFFESDLVRSDTWTIIKLRFGQFLATLPKMVYQYFVGPILGFVADILDKLHLNAAANKVRGWMAESEKKYVQDYALYEEAIQQITEKRQQDTIDYLLDSGKKYEAEEYARSINHHEIMSRDGMLAMVNAVNAGYTTLSSAFTILRKNVVADQTGPGAYGDWEGVGSFYVNSLADGEERSAVIAHGGIQALVETDQGILWQLADGSYMVGSSIPTELTAGTESTADSYYEYMNEFGLSSGRSYIDGLEAKELYEAGKSVPDEVGSGVKKEQPKTNKTANAAGASTGRQYVEGLELAEIYNQGANVPTKAASGIMKDRYIPVKAARITGEDTGKAMVDGLELAEIYNKGAKVPVQTASGILAAKSVPVNAAHLTGEDTGKAMVDGLELRELYLKGKAMDTNVTSGINAGKGTVVSASTAMGKAAGTGAKTGIESTNSSVYNSAVNNAKQAQNGYNNQKSSLYNVTHSVASYAAQGFLNGLSAKDSLIQQKLKKLADQSKKTLQNALQESSPSRLFKKIGAYATEGFAIGIEDEQLAAVRAVQKVANAVTNTGAASLPGIVSGHNVPYGSLSSSSTTSTTNDYNKPVTKGDLEDILTKVVSKYMNIDFYIGDEQISRHADAGKQKINRKYSTIAVG